MQGIATESTQLLSFLRVLAPDSSQNTLRGWIAAGRVSIDGKRVDRANTPIAPGQQVEVGQKVSFMRDGIKILFEDEHLVVLEKPEGLLSVATNFEKRINVHEILKRRFHKKRVFPVHRLDRETSGVMLFAYTTEARDHLKEQFEKRSIEKTYYALVEGRLASKKGTWESYLEEDELYVVRSTQGERGKLAITHYEVISSSHQFTLLRLKLQTGRKNQLRVHCSEAGHPIVGDQKYGAHSNPYKRLCLHAECLSFVHPENGKRMSFQAILPLCFQ